jgi:triosephosphate isomerase
MLSKTKKYVVGNWKMNCDISEARKLAFEITKNSKLKTKNLEIILCPPFTALSVVSQIIQSSNHPIIRLGAQNCHFLPCGAYTGEISPKMVADFCQYVILGHSERRKYFGETDEVINKKIKASLEYNLKPIVCVGEWKKGDSSQGIFKQVKEAIKNLKEKEIKKLIFAYEPVWAIGTGDEAEPSYANKIIREIKETVGKPIPVLYGGSVDASNILGFVKQEMIDGVLVGGASIKAREFLKIISKVKSQIQSPNVK